MISSSHFSELVPANWQSMKLKHVALLKSGDSITSDSINDVGEYQVFGGNGVRGYTDSFTHSGTHVLIGRQGALCGNINYASGEFWASEHAIVASLKGDHNVFWLGELLRSMNLNQYSQAAAQPGIGVEVIANISIPVPPRQEQDIIADYLQRETAYIDALVSEKKRMLSLLAEKWKTLKSTAVTKGLNSDAVYVDSGFDWLGSIPNNWGIERAKNLFSIRDQRSETGEEELLTVSHITGVTSRSEKEVNMFQAEDKAGYKVCYPGDLVINTLWGWMGAMGVSPLEGIVSPDYHVYTSKGQLLPEYIDLLCRSNPFVAEVNRWSKGVWSSRLRLYPENFFEIHLPVPPLEEQRTIIQELEAIQIKEKELIDTLHKSIELAKEYRSALITSAVTGQTPVEEMTA